MLACPDAGRDIGRSLSPRSSVGNEAGYHFLCFWAFAFGFGVGMGVATAFGFAGAESVDGS